jgi:hypothetical protein
MARPTSISLTFSLDSGTGGAVRWALQPIEATTRTASGDVTRIGSPPNIATGRVEVPIAAHNRPSRVPLPKPAGGTGLAAVQAGAASNGGACERTKAGRVDKRSRRLLWWGLFAIAVLAGGLVAYRLRPQSPSAAPATESAAAPPPAVAPSEVHPWKEAARLVEEDRGQAIGRAARVHVPAELRHYANKKRFLALQVAGWMEKDYPIPGTRPISPA